MPVKTSEQKLVVFSVQLYSGQSFEHYVVRRYFFTMLRMLVGCFSGGVGEISNVLQNEQLIMNYCF